MSSIGITKKQRAIQSVMFKIRSHAIKTPAGGLMVGIIGQAASDLLDPYHRENAQKYLSSDMEHAWACGLDSTWVTRLFRGIGEI